MPLEPRLQAEAAGPNLIKHEHWMQKALGLAESALSIHEVPVGALIIQDDSMVGWGFNRREVSRNSLGHAEIDAIARASKTLGSWRLSRCTLYVTLEPCLMCAGALVQARVDKIVFGAFDPKAGAMGSLYSIHSDTRLNHQIDVTSGVLAEPASAMLKAFFQERRRQKRLER